MKKLFAFALIVFLIIIGREKNLFKDEVPEFIISEIQYYENQNNTTPTIWEYEYHGQRVYLFKYNDQSTPDKLYAGDANLLYVNNKSKMNQKSEYQDFVQNRKGERLIWSSQN